MEHTCKNESDEECICHGCYNYFSASTVDAVIR